MSPPKSDVCKHFSKNDDGTATCRYCHKKLKTSGNTSNLMGHISRLHKLLTPKDTKQPSLQVCVQEKTDLEANPLPPRETIITASSSSSSQQSQDRQELAEADDVSTASGSSQTRIIQSQIIQRFQNIQLFADGGTKFNNITNAILFLICKDMQPFNIVHNEGFRHLMKTVAPLYKLPSKDTFSRRLDDKYEATVTF